MLRAPEVVNRADASTLMAAGEASPGLSEEPFTGNGGARPIREAQERVLPGVSEVLTLESMRGRDRELDAQSFKDIKSYFDELLSYALSRTKGDYHTAEEAVQETMIAALYDWPRILSATEPRNYLKKIVQNKIVDLYRSNSRIILVGDPTDLDPLGQAHEDASFPLLHQEAQDDVRRLVNQLPKMQRLVMQHYLEDIPMAEISEGLGISLATARVHLMRARAALIKAMSEQWQAGSAAEHGPKS